MPAEVTAATPRAMVARYVGAVWVASPVTRAAGRVSAATADRGSRTSPVAARVIGEIASGAADWNSGGADVAATAVVVAVLQTDRQSYLIVYCYEFMTKFHSPLIQYIICCNSTKIRLASRVASCK